MKKFLREIFPMMMEDMGGGAMSIGDLSTAAIQMPDGPLVRHKRLVVKKKKKPINKITMQTTEAFNAITESARRVMLGEASQTTPSSDVDMTPENDSVPETPAPTNVDDSGEVEDAKDDVAPKAKTDTGKSKSTPKFAVTCDKDGTSTVLLLSKEDLEKFIHENGVKCIASLYELGKEAKIPEASKIVKGLIESYVN